MKLINSLEVPIMKKPLLLFSIIILSEFSQAQIQLSGALSGILQDTTYIVVGNISVPAGDSLFIEAGAILIFNSNKKFDIDGYIYAAGSVNDSIKFINSTGSNWGGIDFNTTSSDSSLLAYCLISGGYATGPWPETCGGGIYCEYSANPSIINCTISGNTAQTSGGGISIYYDCNPVISGCLICGNTAQSDGGGIQCYDNCNPMITNCIISDNVADHGGGINCSYNSSPTISYCVISGNYASYNGGGIHCYATSNPVITNCTISENTSNQGGGIYLYTSVAQITNSIVEGSSGSYGVYFQYSSLSSIEYSDFYANEIANFYNPPNYLGWITGVNNNGDPCDNYNNIFLNPLFINPVNGDYNLLAGSPCIDAGDPDSPLEPDSTIADMGAFYFCQSMVEKPPRNLLPSVISIYCHPNPFNSIIQISYTVPISGKIAIRLMDITGRETALVTQGWKAPGSYHTSYSPDRIACGVYFLQIQTGTEAKTIKIVYLK